MAKALIALDEVTLNWKNVKVGLRVIDIYPTDIFVPEENHFWVDCPDGLELGHCYYDETSQTVLPILVDQEQITFLKMRQEYEAKRKVSVVSTGAIVV